MSFHLASIYVCEATVYEKFINLRATDTTADSSDILDELSTADIDEIVLDKTINLYETAVDSLRRGYEKCDYRGGETLYYMADIYKQIMELKYISPNRKTYYNNLRYMCLMRSIQYEEPKESFLFVSYKVYRELAKATLLKCAHDINPKFAKILIPESKPLFVAEPTKIVDSHKNVDSNKKIETNKNVDSNNEIRTNKNTSINANYTNIVFLEDSYYEPWNGATEKLGGSEKAMVRVMEFLASQFKKSHKIYAFLSNCIPGTINSVQYKNMSEFDDFANNNFIKIAICMRNMRILKNAHKTSVKHNFLWVHDIYPTDSQIIECPTNFARFIFLTKWHLDTNIKGFNLPREQCFILPNMPDLSLILPDSNWNQRGMSFIYTSAPYRGLYELLAYYMPVIWEKYPQAKLTVLSAIDDPKFYVAGYNKDKALIIKKLIDKCNQEGKIVRNLGRKSQAYVYNELKKNKYWLYPTTFMETYCYAGIEALTAGCVCIHTDIGALKEVLNGFSHCITAPKDVLGVIEREERMPTEQQIIRYSYIKKYLELLNDNIKSGWTTLVENAYS